MRPWVRALLAAIPCCLTCSGGQQVATTIAPASQPTVATEAEVAAPRLASVAIVAPGLVQNSSFCTANGLILVVHSGFRDANGDYSIGNTLITGTNTFRLGPGNAVVAKACYTHKLENTTAYGSAWAKSTIWYDP
ncbi:MAG TPA: hypothetical protein VIQ98_11055 [Gemmatimonadales bacterium]|jgi:hypothetical protein